MADRPPLCPPDSRFARLCTAAPSAGGDVRALSARHRRRRWTRRGGGGPRAPAAERTAGRRYQPL